MILAFQAKKTEISGNGKPKGYFLKIEETIIVAKKMYPLIGWLRYISFNSSALSRCKISLLNL